ncbi:MAG TPA: hypothetical protein VNJ54_01630 [Plantibacter sp.]|uniref:hypothetical protein n=1 Tax=Plantibacter sp. TaxID=1871045 RepID=UPI002B697020|nr:hypothetical protein [Plantibacter sp.]
MRVGESLLDHAVGDKVDRARQRRQLALGAELHTEAGRRELLDQRVQSVESRLRGTDGALALLRGPQDLEERADLPPTPNGPRSG